MSDNKFFVTDILEGFFQGLDSTIESVASAGTGTKFEPDFSYDPKILNGAFQDFGNGVTSLIQFQRTVKDIPETVKGGLEAVGSFAANVEATMDTVRTVSDAAMSFSEAVSELPCQIHAAQEGIRSVQENIISAQNWYKRAILGEDILATDPTAGTEARVEHPSVPPAHCLTSDLTS